MKKRQEFVPIVILNGKNHDSYSKLCREWWEYYSNELNMKRKRWVCAVVSKLQNHDDIVYTDFSWNCHTKREFMETSTQNFTTAEGWCYFRNQCREWRNKESWVWLLSEHWLHNDDVELLIFSFDKIREFVKHSIPQCTAPVDSDCNESSRPSPPKSKERGKWRLVCPKCYLHAACSMMILQLETCSSSVTGDKFVLNSQHLMPSDDRGHLSFHSTQECIIALGQAHMHPAPSLTGLSTVTLNTVPLLIWLNTNPLMQIWFMSLHSLIQLEWSQTGISTLGWEKQELILWERVQRLCEASRDGSPPFLANSYRWFQNWRSHGYFVGCLVLSGISTLGWEKQELILWWSPLTVRHPGMAPHRTWQSHQSFHSFLTGARKISYTQWLLLLLFSVHTSTMSKLRKENVPLSETIVRMGHSSVICYYWKKKLVLPDISYDLS